MASAIDDTSLLRRDKTVSEVRTGMPEMHRQLLHLSSISRSREGKIQSSKPFARLHHSNEG
jgi:hypothetical protein